MNGPLHLTSLECNLTSLMSSWLVLIAFLGKEKPVHTQELCFGVLRLSI